MFLFSAKLFFFLQDLWLYVLKYPPLEGKEGNYEKHFKHREALQAPISRNGSLLCAWSADVRQTILEYHFK